MTHPRPTKTSSPIPPYNPHTPKIDQPASITSCTEDGILVFNIAVDDPAHVEECHGVGDLTEIALDEVRGEALRVLLDKVDQVFFGGGGSNPTSAPRTPGASGGWSSNFGKRNSQAARVRTRGPLILAPSHLRRP